MRPRQFPAKPLWFEIAYKGGHRVRGATREDWAAAPQDGVLVVRQPVDKTYLLDGVPTHFTVRLAYDDYYWLGADGFVCSGNAREVTADLDAVKRGAWAERDEFVAAYNAFLADVPA